MGKEVQQQIALNLLSEGTQITGFGDSLLVILAEIRDGAEVWGQFAEQPHNLNVTLALTGKLA